MASNDAYVPPKAVLSSIEAWEKQQPESEEHVSQKDLTRCFIEGRAGKSTVLHVDVFKTGQKTRRVLLHAHSGIVFMTAEASHGGETSELVVHPGAAHAPPTARDTIDFVALYLWATRVSVLEYGVDIAYPTGETAHGYFSNGPVRISPLDPASAAAIADMRLQDRPKVGDPAMVNVIAWSTVKFGRKPSPDPKYRYSSTHLTIGQTRPDSWDLLTLCGMTVPISNEDGLEPLPGEGLLQTAGVLCESCVAELDSDVASRVIANHGLGHLRDLKRMLGRERNNDR